MVFYDRLVVTSSLADHLLTDFFILFLIGMLLIISKSKFGWFVKDF